LSKDSSVILPDKSKLGAWGLFCLFLLTPVAAWPQSFAGETITEVRIEGTQTLTDETVLFYLGIEIGADFNPRAVNDRIHDLWDRQMIDNIRVDVEPVSDGVRLVITIKERPILRSIEYSGLKRLNKSDIGDKIAQERIRVREGDPLSMGELFRLKRSIEEMYAEKGFRLAEAEFRVEEISTTDRRVLFNIDEGDKVRVGDIDFEGNTVYKDLRLKFTMKKTKESGMISKLRKKDLYNPAKLEEDLDSVRQIYRKAGYKNVVMGEPIVEVRAMNPAAKDTKQQKRRLFITVPIEEGDRWKLGEISIEGNDTFSDEFLLRQFEKPRGGWLRSKVIDEGVEAISEIYSNTGHLFAAVTPTMIEREGQIADLVVQITEGDQFRIRRIELQGNTKTRDKVIRRELGIQEGLVMNTAGLRNSLLRLQQMEIFQVDENDPVTFDIDKESQTVDLTLKGEEGERTELLFGGGFSEVDGLFGQAQFRTRNFMGRGETFGVSAQLGARQNLFDVNYSIPWFLDRPQSIGFNLFKRELDYTLLTGQTFFQDNVGGAFTYGRNLGLFGNASVTFSRFDAKERRTEFTPQGELVEQNLDRTVAMLRFSYVKDRRNARLQPTAGYRYSFVVDYAGGVLGGTTNFVRPQVTAAKYFPVKRTGLQTSFAINTKIGLIEPLEGKPLFFNDRFYLGGENSIRGFQYRAIWVRDPKGNSVLDEFGFPLGGDKTFQLNGEMIVVLGGPFRAVLYSDAGKVFADDESLNLTNIRITAGAELQVNVPILGAPLRFIYAYNVNPLPDDRFETFQFSIGPSF
jgi:outer membrane protein insertion porin family